MRRRSHCRLSWNVASKIFIRRRKFSVGVIRDSKGMTEVDICKRAVCKENKPKHLYPIPQIMLTASQSVKNAYVKFVQFCWKASQKLKDIVLRRACFDIAL